MTFLRNYSQLVKKKKALGASKKHPVFLVAWCACTCVSGQLSGDPDIALASLQAIDGADVVQTSTRHVVPRWSVGARHDPGRAQRNGMDLRTGKINSLTE